MNFLRKAIPSILGISISDAIISGLSLTILSLATYGSGAVPITFIPLSLDNSPVSTLRTIAESSTTKYLDICLHLISSGTNYHLKHHSVIIQCIYCNSDLVRKIFRKLFNFFQVCNFWNSKVKKTSFPESQKSSSSSPL